jgi:methylmalonyl-CoA carboxyltransferase small subunit
LTAKSTRAEIEVIEDEESEQGEPPRPVSGSYLPYEISGVLAQSNHSSAGRDDKICRSPINGLVIAVNVESGQVVEANGLLMVLEAMKMETQVTAPRAGTVKNVLVAPGASVKLRQTLVEFE